MLPNPADLHDIAITVRLKKGNALFVQAMSASTGMPVAVVIRRLIEESEREAQRRVFHVANDRSTGADRRASNQHLPSIS